MSTDWVPVSLSHHRGCSYQPRKGYAYTEAENLAPVLLAELYSVLPHFVIAFAPVNKNLLPVAILGVEEKQNLYVQKDGMWLAAYVPACFRSEPFRLLSDDKGQKVLAIRREAIGSEGQPLFTDSDELAVQDVLNFLSGCEHNRAQTLKAAAKLEEVGVLEPLELSVPVDGEPTRLLKGLLKVNEEALKELDGKQLERLRGDALKLAYAQLFSLAQVGQLSSRLKLQTQQKPAGLEDVDALFQAKDDTLKFNF